MLLPFFARVFPPWFSCGPFALLDSKTEDLFFSPPPPPPPPSPSPPLTLVSLLLLLLSFPFFFPLASAALPRSFALFERSCLHALCEMKGERRRNARESARARGAARAEFFLFSRRLSNFVRWTFFRVFLPQCHRRKLFSRRLLLKTDTREACELQF